MQFGGVQEGAPCVVEQARDNAAVTRPLHQRPALRAPPCNHGNPLDFARLTPARNLDIGIASEQSGGEFACFDPRSRVKPEFAVDI